MKCKDCSACIHMINRETSIRKNKYVCYGVKEPFEIKDIKNGCTEYPNKIGIVSNEEEKKRK